MSTMSPEEEEAVQAELEALEREAMVCLACRRISSEVMTDCRSLLYPASQRPRPSVYQMRHWKSRSSQHLSWRKKVSILEPRPVPC